MPYSLMPSCEGCYWRDEDILGKDLNSAFRCGVDGRGYEQKGGMGRDRDCSRSRNLDHREVPHSTTLMQRNSHLRT